ncbi:hypothetical protein [uncultured Deefgea sp.]|nr:hypothetical protein [uncultured Deefgea sp.]
MLKVSSFGFDPADEYGIGSRSMPVNRIHSAALLDTQSRNMRRIDKATL